MTPQWLTSLQLPLATAFYKRCGSKEKAKRDERVAVVKDQNNQIVAALRLRCLDGHWLLRALLVAAHCRKQGVALQLLQFIRQDWPEPIWCFPFTHLLSLYLQAGYSQRVTAPEVILAPYSAYCNHQPLLLMCCNPRVSVAP